MTIRCELWEHAERRSWRIEVCVLGTENSSRQWIKLQAQTNKASMQHFFLLQAKTIFLWKDCISLSNSFLSTAIIDIQQREALRGFLWLWFGFFSLWVMVVQWNCVSHYCISYYLAKLIFVNTVSLVKDMLYVKYKVLCYMLKICYYKLV